MANGRRPTLTDAGDSFDRLRPGTRIGGYVVEERISRGGMAVVYRARDQRLGRTVALKVLAPELASDDTFRRRFIMESHAAAAVDDPHVIPVYDAGEDGGNLFIAMRYVPGGDMHSLVRRIGPLEPARAAAIVSSAACALDAAHAAGLVHRDVKPANMLVDIRAGRSDHLYVSDFGLSKGTMASRGVTVAGQFVGTPEFTAPEQIKGKQVDGRADQYSLACAAFVLLTGKPPYPADDVTAVIWAHMTGTPPALAGRCGGLPASVDQVMARALAKDPGDRYPTCRDFADALELAVAPGQRQTGPAPADPPAGPARKSPRPARRPWAGWPGSRRARPAAPARPAAAHRHRAAWLIGSGVLALAIAGTLVAFLLPPGHSTPPAAFTSLPAAVSPPAVSPSALVPPATPAVIPAAYSGTWSGMVASQFLNFQMTVQLTAGQQNGTIAFQGKDGLMCNGQLALSAVAGTSLTLQVVAFAQDCSNGVAVTLTQMSPNALDFSMGRPATHGTLNRTR